MKTRQTTTLLKRWLATACALLAATAATFASGACVLPTPAQQPFNPPIRIQNPDGTNGVSANATGNPASFVTVTLRNVPPGYSVTNQTYIGWCVDSTGALVPLQFDPASIYKPILVGSCDPASLAALGLPSDQVKWNKINYIINNKGLWAALGYNVSEIQAAIWRFIGFDAAEEASILSGSYGFGFPPGNVASVNTILAIADFNGGAFVPGAGQVEAVVLYLPANLQDQVQPPYQNLPGQLCFIEVLCLPPGSIGDTVFCDYNENGIQDAGEPGIPGVKVNISCVTASGTFTDMKVTDANGKYLFSGLAPGTCTVSVDYSTVPLDCNRIIPNCPVTRTVVLGQGQVFLDADFCFAPNLGSIGDTVFCDYNENGIQNPGEPGIPGVKVTLVCVTASGTVTEMKVTDANGKYLFTNLLPGNCTVTVDPTTAPTNCNRIIPNCPLSRTVNLGAGQVFLDADFCFAPQLGIIGDTVFCDLNANGIQEPGDLGIPNVKVTLNCTLTAGGTDMRMTTTDANGKYLFINLQPGTCVVTVDKTTLPPDCNIDVPNCPSSRTVTMVPGLVYLDADFCYTKAICSLDVAAFCTIPQPPGDGDDCNGSKIKSVTMVYTGQNASFSSNTQPADKWFSIDYATLTNSVFIRVSDKDSATDSKAKVWFQGTVTLGNTFTAAASNAGASTLSADSYIHIFSSQGGTLLQKTKFHTSCSQPIAVGNQFGANLIVSMTFADGRTTELTSPVLEKNCTVTQSQNEFCPAGLGNKIESLQLIYTKENCSFSSNSQPSDKWYCTDFASLLNTVYIRVSDKESPTDSKAKVWFQGSVNAGAMFMAKASNAGASTLSADSYIHVFASNGGQLLQRIKLHTSCSQPLNAGDQFGSIVVFAADTTVGGLISLGTEVKFVYKVTNTGTSPVANVVVTDFQGTVPGSPIASIAAGQVIELTRTVTATGDISNTVTVLSLLGGCQDTDTTTITFVPPPPTPKDCTAAIQKTLLKYIGPNVNGAVTVNFLGSSGATASYSFPGGLLSGTTLSLPSQNNWTIDSTVSGQSSLGTKLTITINGVAEVHHTSCSTPYRTGLPAPLDNPKGQPSTLWFVVDFVSKP